MKLSKYNYLFDSPKYGSLLYFGETNSFAKISKDLFDELKRIEDNPGSVDEYIEKLDKGTRDVLIRAGFFVENTDELLNQKRFEYYKKTWNFENLALVLVPTRGCNFSCPYCFESDRPAISMSQQIEQDVVKFVQKHKKADFLHITWFGGEPLMKFDTIERLMSEFKKNTHMELATHAMTTNGYLLDEYKCRFFQNYPLTKIQFTIDGDKKMHDSRRVLKPNKPTYDKIMGNIDRFIYYNPNTLVAIRVNLDSTNVGLFPTILKEYNKIWKDLGKKVYVYPAFVKDYSESCKNNCQVLSLTQKMDLYNDLHEIHHEKLNVFPEFRVAGCSASMVNGYVIGPEGELYKCWTALGMKEEIIGHVYSDKIENMKLLMRYLAGPTMLDDEKCIACKLFPTCVGGCLWDRHQTMYKGKDYDRYYCNPKIENLERALELFYETLT